MPFSEDLLLNCIIVYLELNRGMDLDFFHNSQERKIKIIVSSNKKMNAFYALKDFFFDSDSNIRSGKLLLQNYLRTYLYDTDTVSE